MTLDHSTTPELSARNRSPGAADYWDRDEAEFEDIDTLPGVEPGSEIDMLLRAAAAVSPQEPDEAGNDDAGPIRGSQSAPDRDSAGKEEGDPAGKEEGDPAGREDPAI